MRLVARFTIPGTPVAQARSRHRVANLGDGKRFAKQYDPTENKVWKGQVADFAFRAMAGQPPIAKGPLVVEAVFVFMLPPSAPKWQHRQVAAGTEIPKDTKPDLDNLIKGVVDGMKGIAFRDDGQVYSYGNSRRVFGPRAEVRVAVLALEEARSRPAPQPALALA
jgi:Holliday junction resolvase RusA-like endonuclease